MYRVTHPYWNSQVGNTQTYIILWSKPCDSTEEAGQLYFMFIFCLSFELYFLLLGWFCFLKTVKEIKADSKFIQCWYCLANNCKYVQEKEFKKDLPKWKDIPHSWIGRHDIVKMQYSPNKSTDSTQSWPKKDIFR